MRMNLSKLFLKWTGLKWAIRTTFHVCPRIRPSCCCAMISNGQNLTGVTCVSCCKNGNYIFSPLGAQATYGLSKEFYFLEKTYHFMIVRYRKTSSISCALYQKLNLKNCQVISQNLGCDLFQGFSSMWSQPGSWSIANLHLSNVDLVLQQHHCADALTGRMWE